MMAAALDDDSFESVDANQPLDSETRDHLRSHLDYLTSNLDVAPLLQTLCQKGAISLEKKDEIKAEPTPARQAATLVDVFNRGSKGQFIALLETLETHKQYAVLRVLKTRHKEKGAVVKVQSTLLTNLKRHEASVIDNLRFEESFLLNLVTKEVITENQREYLQSISSRINRAEELVTALQRGGNDERMEQLAHVLTETGQDHLSAIILGQGAIDVLSKDEKQKMRPHLVKYVTGLKEIDAVNNLRQLVQLGVITAAHMEEVQNKTTPNEKTEFLLNILMCRPCSALKKLQAYAEVVTYARPGALAENSSQSQPILLPLPEPKTDSSQDITEGPRHACLPLQETTLHPRQARQHIPLTSNVKEWVMDIEDEEGGRIHADKYQEQLRQFQECESRHSNLKIKDEFGFILGSAVFYIALLLVPRNALLHGPEELKRGFEQQHDVYVDTSSLFAPDSKGCYPRRILLLGAAGSGKSTLAQYATEQWGLGRLWTKFKYVFHLTCRRFNKMVENKTRINLLDLLLKHGPPIPEGEKTGMRAELAFNQQHILIVVDGIDELSGWIQFDPDKTLPPRDIYEPDGILELVTSLMVGEMLEESSVLITSRPIDKIDLDQFDQTVKIFGFGRESIEKCILALARENIDDQRAALEYLDYRPHLYLFCTLPLGCIMTGRIVLDELARGFTDQHQHEHINCATMLYIYVLLVFLGRRGDHTARIKDRLMVVYTWYTTLWKMMNLAAWGVLQSSPNIIFSAQTLQEHAIDTNDLPCGLLDITTDSINVSDEDVYTSAAFVHYSIQEFLTALYIAITWQKADIKMVTNRKASQTFNMVLLYLSGLLGNPLGQKLIRALDDKLTTKTLYKRLMRLFDILLLEYEGRLRFLPTFTKRGKDRTKLGRLQLLRCAAEGNHKDLVRKVDGLVVKEGVLDLTDMPGGLLVEHMPAVAFFINWSKAVRTLRLEISYCLSLMRMITAENKGRLVPLLDDCVLEREQEGDSDSGYLLDLRATNPTKEDLHGFITYIMHSAQVARFRLEITYCLRLMRMITTENQGRLVTLLDDCVLEREEEGDGNSGHLLDLRDTNTTEEDLHGFINYTMHSTQVTKFRLEISYCLCLMRMITAENQGRLVPLLDDCVLEREEEGDGDSGYLLDLQATNPTKEDLHGFISYTMHSTQVTKLKLEPVYCCSLVNMKNPDTERRIVTLIDTALLQSGQLDLHGLHLSEEEAVGLCTYVLSTKSLQAVERYTAIQLMGGITAENQTRLVPLLVPAALKSGVLDLKDTKLSDTAIDGIVTYVMSIQSLQTCEKYTAVQLMRGITTENKSRLVPLLDTVALQSGVLNLKDTKLFDNDIIGIVTYVLSTQSLQAVEGYTAIQIMRGITTENQARLVPVLDRCVLESWRGGGRQWEGTLDLSYLSITEDDVSALAHYVGLTAGITHLGLWRCGVTDKGAGQLASALKDKTSLLGLELGGNRITSVGADSLARALHTNSSLKILLLGENNVTDVGADRLARALYTNSTLHALNLYRNALSDVGAESLATALRHNGILETLSLQSNTITDAGADHLASALRDNQALTKLGLWGNKLSFDKEGKILQEFSDRVWV